MVRLDGCTFTRQRLARLSQIETRHFWFVGRRALLDRLLRRYLDRQSRLVLDIGCGTGLTLSSMARHGQRVVGLDARPEGLAATRRALPSSWLIQADGTRLPFVPGISDAVLALDVLEHLDDRACLAEVHRVLRPGGLAVITVPAMPWLWSYRDEAAGHRRRYTRGSLRGILTASELQVQEMRFYQCLLFPFVALTRVFGRRDRRLRDIEERPLPILNAGLSWVNRLEARFGDLISWPWGSSLVVICRKAGTGTCIPTSA